MTTGERIRHLRFLKKLTLDEVAESIGTIKQTVYKYEHGIVSNIPDDKILALSKALDTTPEYLRCSTDDPRPFEDRIKLTNLFKQRLSSELENADCTDISEMLLSGSLPPWVKDFDDDVILSLDDAYNIASTLGVSLDYLTGLGNVMFLLKQGERSGKIKEKEEEKDMATVKVKCPYCGSEEVVLYGKSSTGKQRYLCQNKECSHKTFQLEYKNNASRPGMKEKIVEMVMNGAGTRDTGRVLEVSKDTVTAVLKKRENLLNR